MNVFLGELHRQHRQRENDDEENPGHGRGVAHPEVLERVVVEIDGEEVDSQSEAGWPGRLVLDAVRTQICVELICEFP